MNPTVCFTSQATAFSLEGINLCTEFFYCDGFVQVGWIKEKTDSAPKMYCEYGAIGSFQDKQFFAMTPQQQTYWWYQSGGRWYCALGTSIKIPAGVSLGWTSGTRFQAQGETNSTHTQIGGYPPPASILFWNMQYRAGAWYQTDLWDIAWESPYFVYEPTPGEMRNGTNLHNP